MNKIPVFRYLIPHIKMVRLHLQTFIMKKIIMFSMLLSFCSICFAQIKTDTTRKTVVTKTATQTTQQQSITPAPNTVVPKLPDLRITNATASATATSPGVYKLTMQCTVKNDGTAPISYDQVGVYSLIAAERDLGKSFDSHAYSPGCGSVAGQPRDILQPGQSVTVVYYCFNIAMEKGDKPVYIFLLDKYGMVKELNEGNNQQNVYITFN